MAVTKHDIEWLIQTLELHGPQLSEELVNRATDLISQSQYRKSVCVIHPVDDTAYRQVRGAIQQVLRHG